MFKNSLFILSICMLLAGCSGMQTFSASARAGDTTIVAAGWKKNFSRDEITVTITPSSGAPFVYLPGDPAIRAVVNLYPDPLSSLIVSDRSDQDITTSAQIYSYLITFNADGDRDWWETTVYLDLPDTLPPGEALITIENMQGDSVSSSINIVDGPGQSDEFLTKTNGALRPEQLVSLERVSHYEVTISASIVPYAVELRLSHNPDNLNGGVGQAHVINPRGDIKNVSWNGDGHSLRVLLTPVNSMQLDDVMDFKFYVAGGIEGLIVDDVIAVSETGSLLSGVSAIVSQY